LPEEVSFVLNVPLIGPAEFRRGGHQNQNNYTLIEFLFLTYFLHKSNEVVDGWSLKCSEEWKNSINKVPLFFGSLFIKVSSRVAL
jgi:hypothetical protein